MIKQSRSRDATSHPSFAASHAKKSSSLKRREAERRQAHQTGPHRRRQVYASLRKPSADAARAVLFSSPLARLRREGARSPLGAPPRHSPRFYPRLGSGPRFLESPDPNGRTLSGTSAASTSRSDHAPDGSMPRTARTRGDEPRPRDRPRSVNRPSPVTPFDERDSRLITETVTVVKGSVTHIVTPSRPCHSPRPAYARAASYGGFKSAEALEREGGKRGIQ